ncbi:MAG: hypothetical protein PHU94_02440 [Bacilli bacterium]|nr:hypothetical protein [Bacilli bacterium]MDD4733644.1 hypothetical protein [Bacilli bacterium]
MKKIYKENKLFLVVFLFLISIGLFSVIRYKINYQNIINNYNEVIKEYPEYIVSDENLKMVDAFSIYTDIFLDFPLALLMVIAPLVVIMASTYTFYNFFNSSVWKNHFIRNEYKKEIKKQFKKVYKYALILPIFILLLMVICFIISGNLDIIGTIKRDLDNVHFGLEYFYISNSFELIKFIKFIFYYFIGLILWSLFYVNVFLIIMRKSIPYAVNVILSYLIIIGIDIILEVFLGSIFYFKFGFSNKVIYSLNIFNYWTYQQLYSIDLYMIYTLLFVVITSIIIHFLYKEKWSVIERNEV